MRSGEVCQWSGMVDLAGTLKNTIRQDSGDREIRQEQPLNPGGPGSTRNMESGAQRLVEHSRIQLESAPGRLHHRIRVSPGVGKLPAVSSPQPRAGGRLDFIPGDNITREGIVIRNAAIQLRALHIGQGECLGINTYACPNFFDQRKPFAHILAGLCPKS